MLNNGKKERNKAVCIEHSTGTWKRFRLTLIMVHAYKSSLPRPFFSSREPPGKEIGVVLLLHEVRKSKHFLVHQLLGQGLETRYVSQHIINALRTVLA